MLAHRALFIVASVVLGASCVSPRSEPLSVHMDAEAGDDQAPGSGRHPGGPLAGGETDGPPADGPPSHEGDAPLLAGTGLKAPDGPSCADAPTTKPDGPGGNPGCGSGDPNRCGPGCQVCPTPYNGKPICTASGCDVACDSGYHACDKVCYPDDDATHCGASCADCPNPPGGVASCKSGTCNSFCMNGYHSCGGTCYRDDDLAHCGLACKSCPMPAHGRATCSGSCDVTCDSGYHACGTACYADSDSAHCGAACDSCPGTAGGTPACRNGRCDATCNAGTFSCGGSPPACLVPSWTFESGGTQGWSLVTGAGQHTAGGPVYVSTARAHGGSHALATDVSVNFAQDAFVVSIAVDLCASGGVDLGGRTISMWAYFDGPAVDNRVVADPYVYTTNGTSYDPLSFNGQMSRTPLSNQWFEIKAVVPASEDHIAYQMKFFTNLNIDRWTGTIYLDDITLK